MLMNHEQEREMKVAHLYESSPIEKHPLRMEKKARPIPSQNQVVIRVISCGVCRSNLHMIEGDWSKYGVPSRFPIIPGHEVIGEVDMIGDGVDSIRLGDRVGLQPLYESCRSCNFCRIGRENLCLRREILGETVDGGYCEYVKAPHDFVYPIPDELDPITSSPLLCPGVTAYRAVKRSRIKDGQSMGIFGIGGVGHLAVQFANLAGASVTAISRSEDHRDLARELDVERATSPEDVKNNNPLFDSAIVFAPSDEIINLAIRSVRRGGTIVVGVFGTISDLHFDEEKTIVGSVIGTRNDVLEVLEVAKRKQVRVIAKVFPLHKANEVLSMVKNGEIKGRAVLTP